jgi:hypothetical protein
MDQKNSVRLQEEVTLTGIAIHGVKLLAFLNQQTAGNSARFENPAIHEGIDRDVFALILKRKMDMAFRAPARGGV